MVSLELVYVEGALEESCVGVLPGGFVDVDPGEPDIISVVTLKLLVVLLVEPSGVVLPGKPAIVPVVPLELDVELLVELWETVAVVVTKCDVIGLPVDVAVSLAFTVEPPALPKFSEDVTGAGVWAVVGFEVMAAIFIAT